MVGKIRREDPYYYLPTPELYVIYTGDSEVPDEIDISDLYLPKPDGTKPLSLKVKLIKSSDKIITRHSSSLQSEVTTDGVFIGVL